MGTVDLLTVATVDYTPQALATLKSARRIGEYASYYLFALDAPAETVRLLQQHLGEEFSWIQVFGPDDLTVNREVFLATFKYYNPFELSCLAKYVAMAHVLNGPKAADICAYADADILFLESVSETCEEIRPRTILLTPHQLSPTSDALEHEYLLHGWINAGFFCFRRDPRALMVLDWLVHRISRRGYQAPHLGLFVDQAWLSSLPFLFHDETFLSQDPGLNVAYWNLEERTLTRSGDTIDVNGHPLLFFHFSGFDPSATARLSKHTDARVEPGSALDDLCKRYAMELESVAGLRSKVVDLKRLPCSKANLQERMLKGAIQNGLNLSEPTLEVGLFLRLGRKMDVLLSKLTG